MKFTILLAALFVLNLQLSAIDFRITDLTHGNQGQPEVRFTAATDYYYILYRGDHPSDVTTAATLGLGLNGGRLSDPTRLLEISQFYRLRQVPLDQPLDLDADGIDDVYELSHQDFLNPLNPADANESFTPSLTKLDEYLLQRDPNRVPQVFVNNATISCGDTRYDGRHIVVNGATLTLDCVHTFKSLTVTNGGVVTHSAGLSNGLKLTITETVFVSSNSALSFSAKGYAPGQGPGTGIAGSYAGGGGHGGRGGNGSSGGQGGGTYGSVSEPTDFGSGSGGGSSHGGGSMCLWVGGNLHVDGTISADGQTSGGGGSGGSLWLQTSRLSGSGLISANGGDANSSSGGGGGGRIAIYSRTNDFSGQVQALGGSGLELGGAGTIYFKTGTAALGTLVIANRWHENRGSQPTELAGVWTFDALIIESNGWLSHPLTNALDLIASNVDVKAGGFLSLNAKGYAPGQGPGAGNMIGYGGGGGYGGDGGSGTSGGLGGAAYGSMANPTDFGSGGGNAWGGGALRLRVSQELTVNGIISANGQTTGGKSVGGNGGAGGSLWLEAGKLIGRGVISANGGNANTINAGGGGGGRIAIYTKCAPDLGMLTVEALGGTGQAYGEVGTIYFGIHESGLIGATSFAGDITSIATPPSVDFQQLTNSQTMFFFSEQTNVTLGFPLAANITSPGRYDSQAALHDSLGHIPSGTPISSYYIHFDTGLTNKAESEVSLTNTLTFDSEILGVILLTPQLITSDSAVGNLATVYPSLELNSLRGFEVGENIGQDWVELHADRRTITISARVRDWADQLRIITSAYNRCED